MRLGDVTWLRDVPWKAIVIAVVAAITYCILLITIAPNEIWGWLSTLLATFISVFTGIAIFRHQSNEADRERWERLNRALLAELIVIVSYLERKDVDTGSFEVELPSGRIAEAIVREVEPVILVEFTRSGVLEPELVGYYSAMVTEIHSYNSVFGIPHPLQNNSPAGRKPEGGPRRNAIGCRPHS
jgi:hypothetical protein